MKVKANSVFYKRKSPRQFENSEVSKEDLMTLFEAARWAASSFNEQPWRFIYAEKTSSDAYSKLYSCLSEKNQKWAGEAPVLMLTIAKSHFSKNDKPNRHAWHDVGMAMGNFCIQATHMGFYVHQMAGFYPDKSKELLDLPDGFEPVAMAAVGYSSEEKTGRSRKPLDEIVFDLNEVNTFEL